MGEMRLNDEDTGCRHHIPKATTKISSDEEFAKFESTFRFCNMCAYQKNKPMAMVLRHRYVLTDK